MKDKLVTKEIYHINSNPESLTSLCGKDNIIDYYKEGFFLSPNIHQILNCLPYYSNDKLFCKNCVEFLTNSLNTLKTYEESNEI